MGCLFGDKITKRNFRGSHLPQVNCASTIFVLSFSHPKSLRLHPMRRFLKNTVLGESDWSLLVYVFGGVRQVVVVNGMPWSTRISPKGDSSELNSIPTEVQDFNSIKQDITATLYHLFRNGFNPEKGKIIVLGSELSFPDKVEGVKVSRCLDISPLDVLCAPNFSYRKSPFKFIPKILYKKYHFSKIPTYCFRVGFGSALLCMLVLCGHIFYAKPLVQELSTLQSSFVLLDKKLTEQKEKSQKIPNIFYTLSKRYSPLSGN